MIASATALTRFRMGETVTKTGWYLCVPCGYLQEFSAGNTFTACEVCRAGTDDGPEGYTDKESEFWEFIQVTGSKT